MCNLVLWTGFTFNVFYMVPQALIQPPNLSLYKVQKSFNCVTSSQQLKLNKYI